MELEEMKNTWQSLSKRVEKQELQTNQILEKLKQEKYHSKLNKIGYSEYVGTIVCYIGAAYLTMNFTKVDSLTMQIFAIIAIVLLFVLPVISLKSLQAVRNVNIPSMAYIDAIEDFAHRKIKFQRLKKLNVSLGLFLMLVAVPVLSSIQGKAIAQVPHFWTLIFPVSIIFFLAFAMWVLKSYNKILKETEKILSDIHS
ncbi:hypothetical protein MM236_18935 [Belliella sp. DSM 107340]|uniref:Uncharacterized protein n=1 Tax=Belliella calami TaxID=2923436 RepID=A0ABS9UUA7_9BACT|nr:hypothetical protein [Belliella calami]MCH7400078.1 hypothetical protein [Belliella calami]